jgi:hypothetical protein
MADRISRRKFLALTAVALAGPLVRIEGTNGVSAVPADLDHILLGVSDLDHGIAWFEQRSGVRAVSGGVHPGRATRNALLALGPRRYLEIIAPDPQQAGSAAAREWWAARLVTMREPRLVGWAAHTNDLASLAKNAAASGVAVEPVRDGSRSRPDGAVLRWKSFGLKDDRNGLLPFFIEWSRDSVHPAQDAPGGCRLVQFSAESPAADQLASEAAKLGLGFSVGAGKASLLRARILGVRGEFELT